MWLKWGKGFTCIINHSFKIYRWNSFLGISAALQTYQCKNAPRFISVQRNFNKIRVLNFGVIFEFRVPDCCFSFQLFLWEDV